MIIDLCQQTGAKIRQVCRSLDLPRSSFYFAANQSASQIRDRELGDLITAIFDAHKRRYGYRRICRELSDRGHRCSYACVRRVMVQRGLRAIQPRSFSPKTSDGRADKPAPNLLASIPEPSAPDQIWAGDITFIRTARGFLYLAVVIDLCSRKIVGWSLANHMRASLVVNALNQAIQTRAAGSQTIFHSDRGSQYSSNAFRAVLKRARIRQSMSARANPYDNAWTESFIGTLKREMPSTRAMESQAEVSATIFEYIAAYYNTRRKHSSLGYTTPLQFEENLAQLN